MANSYLTPDWLMQDIGKLVGDTLTAEEFDERYSSGWVDPLQGRRRYYYDYDPFGNMGMQHHDEGGSRWTADTSFEGYKFHSRDDAYQAYLDSVERGIGTGSKANIFDPASFVSGIERAQGMEEGTEDPEAFTAFTPEMFKKLRTEYYQPELEKGRMPLLDKLLQRQNISKFKGGGISGYGGRERGIDLAETAYRGGVGQIYTGIEEKKAQSLQDIYDTLSQYEAIRTT